MRRGATCAHLHDCDVRAGPRRIEHDDVPMLAKEAPIGLCEIGRQEPRVAEAVERRIAYGARDQAGLALDAEYRRRALGERQAEVAEAAIQIENAVAGLDSRRARPRRPPSGASTGRSPARNPSARNCTVIPNCGKRVVERSRRLPSGTIVPGPPRCK